MEENKTIEGNKIEKSESNKNKDDEIFLLFMQFINYYNCQKRMDKVLKNCSFEEKIVLIHQ